MPTSGSDAVPPAVTRGPLRNVTVVDLTTQLPGPYATMLLRALGARVVKIEPPGGDAARQLDPEMFARVNAGKEIIELDLKQLEDRHILHRLVRQADVFIEGFRPGVAERLGADFPTLSATSEGLVYCSLSGFGQSGPMVGLPAHDLNLLALAGGLDHRRDDRYIGIPTVDLAAGTNAALAIVAAIHDPDRSDEGFYLDMALLDAAIVWSAVKQASTPDAREPTYGVFTASDGRRLAVAVLEDSAWQRLCRALGWSEWADHSDFRTYQRRCQRAEEISERLERALSTRPLEHWTAQAQQHGLPLTPVLDLAAAARDGQVRSRGLLGVGRPLAPLPEALRVDPPGGARPRDADRDALLAELADEDRRLS